MAKVYLVGTEESPKTNQWLAMTNDKEEAAKLLESLEGACRMKAIDVSRKGTASYISTPSGRNRVDVKDKQ